jgi:hypothetical protein
MERTPFECKSLGIGLASVDFTFKLSIPNVALNSIEVKHLTECGRVL